MQYADLETEGGKNDRPGQERHHTPLEGRRSGGKEAEEGYKGTFSRGWKRQILALAGEEAQKLGKEHPTLTTSYMVGDAHVSMSSCFGLAGTADEDADVATLTQC